MLFNLVVGQQEDKMRHIVEVTCELKKRSQMARALSDPVARDAEIRAVCRLQGYVQCLVEGYDKYVGTSSVYIFGTREDIFEARAAINEAADITQEMLRKQLSSR